MNKIDKLNLENAKNYSQVKKSTISKYEPQKDFNKFINIYLTIYIILLTILEKKTFQKETFHFANTLYLEDILKKLTKY